MILTRVIFDPLMEECRVLSLMHLRVKHLHVLEPRYKIPNRKLFSDKQIPALYDKVRREIEESLHKAQTFAVTVDGWTLCATASYVMVTAH